MSNREQRVRDMIEAVSHQAFGRGEFVASLEEIGQLYNVPQLVEISHRLKRDESDAPGFETRGSENNGTGFDDANFVAYSGSLSRLLQEYPGEYVGFLDGKLVGHDKSRQELIDRIYDAYPDGGAFVSKVGPSLRKVTFSRPLRLNIRG